MCEGPGGGETGVAACASSSPSSGSMGGESEDVADMVMRRTSTADVDMTASCVRLGRTLSTLSSRTTAVDCNSERFSADEIGGEDSPIEVQRSASSCSAFGYASLLPRQDSLKPDRKLLLPVHEVNEGLAGIADGRYLYVVMVGDSDGIRMVHEDHLVSEGVLAGHTSLVEKREFMRDWSRQWMDGDDNFRHTVLYAGELEYVEGEGVVEWNNHSGHYQPREEDHVRVGLNPATFVPV
eukprot:TRINITY_DN9588_c0_g1_i1.p1 TRINITY_DN9588_c0_g1~~TRINITY_DN9588_c0_g1_i1.p1  ORF type:complete len:259 (-),score=44.75 TRINITY_DN9588_c0_g1_i1:125-838(-)